MKNITIVNPEEVVAELNARVFIIVLSTSQGTYFGLPGGGICHAEHTGNFGVPPAITRERAAEEYYRVLSTVRSGPIEEGRLDLIALPLFSHEQ